MNIHLAGVVLAANLMLTPAAAVEIIGHRGASYDAPENTVAAIKLAFEQGADAAEFDIHLTKDNKVVVIHDGDLKRVAGVDSKVAESTLVEIRAHEVGQFGNWLGKGFSEKAPSIEEVFKVVPPGKRLYIEIKVQENILPPLGEAIAASGLKPEQLPIITFHYQVAKAAKKRFPAHAVYWLHSWARDKQSNEYPNIDDLIRKATDAKLDGLDLHFNFPIDESFVKKVHAAGLKLCTWTVNDSAVARAQARAGVDGITTDRPGWLRAELAQP